MKKNTTERKTAKVVTRIAPSPTGSFHIGTARTALFNYLFAKQHNGLFLVRFEDTDRERSDRKYEQDILESLQWLGLYPDKIARQSEHRMRYKKYIEELVESKQAYYSREISKKDPDREVEVVRFRNPNRKVCFTDTVRGEITIDTTDLGDFVIARSHDDPLYNLAVVIDDIAMGVTHVLRGDDHIVNTPRQILLMEAFGEPLPAYTHIPLIHESDGGKLSKRKDSASITAFKEKGYVPEALINSIALLSWSPGSNQEIFTLPELITAFSIEGIQKKEAVFNERKLQWFNKQFVQRMPETEIRKALIPSILRRFPLRSRLNPRSVKTVLRIERERGEPFGMVRTDIASGGYDFFFQDPAYNPDLLVQNDTSTHAVLSALKHTRKIIHAIGAYRGWTEERIQKAVWSHAEKTGRALVLWPLRVALSGKSNSPGPFTIAMAIGKRRTIGRLDTAIQLLEKLSE